MYNTFQKILKEECRIFLLAIILYYFLNLILRVMYDHLMISLNGIVTGEPTGDLQDSQFCDSVFSCISYLLYIAVLFTFVVPFSSRIFSFMSSCADAGAYILWNPITFLAILVVLAFAKLVRIISPPIEQLEFYSVLQEVEEEYDWNNNRPDDK